MKILYHPKFAREYRKLAAVVKEAAEKKEQVFRQDPFDPRLKTHKLHGAFRGFWAFSIDYRHRIIFDFVNDSTVRFYAVGGHDVYV